MEKTAAQKFAVGFGMFYVLLGLVGFGFTSGCPVFQECNKGLLGIQLNLMHNIAHMGIGAILVLGAVMARPDVAKGTLVGVGSFYVIVTIIGLTGALINYVSIPAGIYPLDNVFHAASAAVLLLVGLRQEAQQPASTG